MLIRVNEKSGVRVIPIAVHGHAPKDHQEIAKEYEPQRDTITLLPGINEVSADEWELMKLHIERDIAMGDIQVLQFKTAQGSNKPAHRVETIRDLPPKEAIALLKDTGNPETLQRWYSEETRDEVRSALKTRMEELHTPILSPEELEAKLHPGVIATQPIPTAEFANPNQLPSEGEAEDKPSKPAKAGKA